jgi:hypothetical protein
VYAAERAAARAKGVRVCQLLFDYGVLKHDNVKKSGDGFLDGYYLYVFDERVRKNMVLPTPARVSHAAHRRRLGDYTSTAVAYAHQVRSTLASANLMWLILLFCLFFHVGVSSMSLASAHPYILDALHCIPAFLTR